MPPRHAYWTILIDDKPTAFRAREREELQPTFVQLQRKNANVTMRWFARGKLWESREAERDDFQLQRHAASAPREPRGESAPKPERRGGDWRPGGAHKDPRDRFKKKNRPERAWSEKDPETQRDRDKPGYKPPVHRSSFDSRGTDGGKPKGEWRDRPAGPPRGDRPWQKPDGDRPAWKNKPREGGWQGKPRSAPAGAQGFRPAKPGGWRDKPSGPPRDRKPWQDKPPSSRSGESRPAGPNDRPWQTKPTGPRAQRKPWVGKPGPPGEGAGFKPRGDRPPAHRSSSDRPRSDGGWSGKPPSGEKRPWSRDERKPGPAGSGERRPWSGETRRPGPPGSGEKRPWSGKPAGETRPWSGSARRPSPPGSGEKRPWSGKPAGTGERKPWPKKPFTPGGAPRRDVRKKRDDEPPDRG